MNNCIDTLKKKKRKNNKYYLYLLIYILNMYVNKSLLFIQIKIKNLSEKETEPKKQTKDPEK